MAFHRALQRAVDTPRTDSGPHLFTVEFAYALVHFFRLCGVFDSGNKEFQADAPLSCDFFVMVKLRLSLRTAKITINTSNSAPAPIPVPCQRPCLWAAACAATEAFASACFA